MSYVFTASRKADAAPVFRYAPPIHESRDMFEGITRTVYYYYDYYLRALDDAWAHMTPTKYATLLIIVCVFGFVLMKSRMKRA